ncbi:reverse transcriptase [Tanacetum coccineum]|uniref:Reverse transcriptase n=1 Tax=Tanacetum coccineum TaxID=301880 RepID=A0ABQ5HQ77_9ASTR
MVATRSNLLENTTPSNTTPNLEAGIATFQSSFVQINKNIGGLLLFQQFTTTEINGIKNGEGTSHRSNNRGNQYGRLTKLEFLKFYGEDVQGWLYRINQFFTIDHIEDDSHKIRLVYKDLFEALMNKVKLTESYAISLFIGGLKDEIGMAVRMFKLTKLTHVYCMAKMQEQTIVVSKSRHASLLSTPKTSFISENCMPGHKCSGQVFTLEVIRTDMEEDGDLLLLEEGVVNTFHSLVDEQPLISLNALSGMNAYRTLRVKGCLGKNGVHVLIDLRSTHNFLDLQIAKKLGCRLRKICPLDVYVANGNVMTSLYECKGFTWGLQGVTYTADVMIFPLGGCDMVLRIQWLATLGSIQWNSKTLVMEFTYQNKKVILRGTQQTTVHWMQDYESVFEVPIGLPPKRSHNHTIPLIPNTPPISIRPYRHPPNQKDAVELMVKELLDSWVIRNSQSPFSSPIVMVKKKDGSWRMCVDYKQLNKQTVNDKFPILVIEELIDELNGAKVFSKLDLRSSKSLQEYVYHMKQILAVMKTHSLFAKLSKCTFVTNSVEYLGHIISDKGVSTDSSKTKAMQDWPIPQTIKQLRGFLGLTVLQGLIQQLQSKTYVGDKFTWVDGILRRKDKIVVGNVVQLRNNIINHYHSDATGGYSSTTVNVHRHKSLFYWKGLSSSHNKTIIMVVVDILSKYAHFIALQHPFTTSTIAQVFLDNVYKLHGLPESIISDRDKVFLSHFWQPLFKVLKVQLKLSTTYHPQTDRQTEVVNRCLECYLRCVISQKPKEWVQWLSLAEFWYNTNFHTSIQTTPFEAVYGQKPPVHVPYMASESVEEIVDITLHAREHALSLSMIKFHLLQPHKQVTIRQGQLNKLSSKYYGPFLIIEKVGTVAYKLDLPDTSQVHLVFHVSQHKLCKGSTNKMGMMPHCGPNGLLTAKSLAILDRRMKKVNNKVAVYVLVKWSHHTNEDAT